MMSRTEQHLTDPEAVRAALVRMATAPALAIDTETKGLHWYKEGFRPFFISLSDGTASIGFYEPSRYKKELKAIFGNPQQAHIYWNAKFDLHALATIGLYDAGHIRDAMFLARLRDDREPYSLAWQSKTYLGEEGAKLGTSIDDWFKANKIKKDDRDYSQIPPEILAPYAIRDVSATWELYHKHIDAVRELDAQCPMDPIEGMERGLMAVFELECRTVKHLVEIERAGYKVNPEHFRALSPELHEYAAGKRRNIATVLQEQYGWVLPDSCNLASPDDMRELFLDVLNVDPDDLTFINKEGESKLSLAAWLLEKLNNPVADLVLDYREAEKLASSFGEGILEFMGADGNVHADYHQVGANTGRMSCTKPNMQNFPRVDSGDEDAFANKIRRGFVHPEGYDLVFFDYSQLELRIFAYYSQDSVMLQAIRSGEDLHTATACKIFKTDTPTKEQRQKAKTTNFATVYGGGKKTLSKQLGISLPDADMFRAEYLHNFPSIKAFFKEVEEAIQRRGFIRTFWGRRRHLAVDKSYVAVNSIVQGSATGDLHKAGLCAVAEYLGGTGAGFIVNPVHDELGCCIRKDAVREAVPTIKALLESYGKLFDLPLTVDVEISSSSWGEKTKWRG
jgi:DNA polymerase I-like protein with 3'-5' exonuclease and polymerase domains